MSTKHEFLNIDNIGGLGSLSKEDEQKLSDLFKRQKETRLKKSRIIKAKVKSRI